MPDNLTLEISDITGDGLADHLILTKRSLRSPDYKIYTWDPVAGYTQITAPEVRTYRGYVEEDPDIQVNASIEPDNTLQANFNDGRDAIVRLSEAVSISGISGTADPGSGNIIIPRQVDRTSPTEHGYIIPRYTMRQMHAGMDIANDYYLALGSIEAAVARAEQRINDSDHFYARDMGMAWQIQECVVRVGGEPYSWTAWWYSSESAYVNTKIKFKASGGGGSSGIVFDADDKFHQHTCTVGSTDQYSKSLGHEVAHGFGAGHYSSWDDTMSGSNSALGTGTVQRMIDHSNVALETAAPAIIYGAPLCPYVMEDGAVTNQDQPVSFNLLENDYDGNGDSINLEYVQQTTRNGGKVEIVNGGTVRYIPASGFVGVDEFVYYVSDSTGLTNRNGYAKVYVKNENVATHILFDETQGSIVHDVGPFQAHGSLTDGLSFDNSTTGKIGYALENTVDDGSAASADFSMTGDPMDGDLSVSLWVKYPQVPSADGVVICKGGAVIPGRFGSPRGGWCIGHLGSGGFRFAGNLQRDLWQNSEKFDRESSANIIADTWYHLVMVIDRSSKVIRAWVNNTEVNNSTLTSIVPDGMISCHFPLVIFDSQSQQDQGTDSPVIVDDVRIYHKVLDSTEIADLYANCPDIPAGAPDPESSSEVESSKYNLNWMPGKPSIYDFDVYFGQNYEAVDSADHNSPEYKGRTSINSYEVTLIPGNNYYWRIDEIRDTEVIPGQTWNFASGNVSSSYRLDFGMQSTAVETGFSRVVFGETTAVNWANFTLTADTDSVSTQTNGENGDLLYDYVRASADRAKITLTFSNIQDGDYTLKSYQWINDIYSVPEAAWLQEQGSSSSLLIFATDGKNVLPRSAKVSLSSDKTYEFVVQEKNNRNYCYIAGFELIKDNTPPQFNSNPIVEANAAEGKSYSVELMDCVTDPDVDDTITFTKLAGSAWLNLTDDGTATGIPETSDIGMNQFMIEIIDSAGDSATGTLQIEVINMYYGDQGLTDFAGIAYQWHSSDCKESICGADLTNDGYVDINDLQALTAQWLESR